MRNDSDQNLEVFMSFWVSFHPVPLRGMFSSQLRGWGLVWWFAFLLCQRLPCVELTPGARARLRPLSGTQRTEQRQLISYSYRFIYSLISEGFLNMGTPEWMAHGSENPNLKWMTWAPNLGNFFIHEIIVQDWRWWRIPQPSWAIKTWRCGWSSPGADGVSIGFWDVLSFEAIEAVEFSRWRLRIEGDFNIFNWTPRFFLKAMR